MDTNNSNLDLFSFDKSYKNHFDDFDLSRRDLSNMRLKKEIQEEEGKRLQHFTDMKESCHSCSPNNVNYIYKPVYNLYQKEYQEKVNTYKSQLNEYNSLHDYLSNLLENGSLSESQLENTRTEQKNILSEMDKIRENIQSITSIESSLK